MSYGLEFYGANNQLIFDSEGFPDAQVLNPFYYDTNNNLVSGHNSTSSAISYSSDDLLFVRASGNLYGNVTYPSGGGKTFTPSQSVDYFIAKKTSAAGNQTGGGNYGLEIFTSGGATAFSTRRANSSISIIKVFDDKALTDNDSIFSGSSTSNVYVSVGHMFYSPAAGTWACFNYSSTSITFDSFVSFSLPAGGSIQAAIPNMGTLVVATLRS